MNNPDHRSTSSESPIVDEVRARAASISARYGHDLRKYAEHLAELQRRNPDRVVDQPRVQKSDEHCSRSAA
jgi:hypothetical protein